MRSFIFAFCLILTMVAGAKESPSSVEFKRLPPQHLNKSDIKDISNLKGKVVLVDFWAAWCEPCKEALPHYNDLYRKYKPQGLVVLGINEDDDHAERDAFLKTVTLDFPLFYDKNKMLLGDFKVQALPTLYVFDRNLKPVVFYRGFDKKTTQALDKKIQELLKQPRAD